MYKSADLENVYVEKHIIMNVVPNWFISKLSSSCVYDIGFLSHFRPWLRPHSPHRPSIWTWGGARQMLRAHCSFAYSFFGNALD